VYDRVAGAIDAVDPSLLTRQAKGALKERLYVEIYRELGLSPGDVILRRRP
jgi:hypothetical protein